MATPEDVPLLVSPTDETPESYSASCSQYNKGPRKPTDVVFGVLFVLCLIAFVGWSGHGISEVNNNSNRVFAWDFAPQEWVVQNGQCVRTGTPAPTTPPPTIHMSSTEQTTLADLVVAPAMTALVGGFFLGVLLLLGFKYKPYHMVYFACFVQVLAPVVLGIYLMHLSGSSAQTNAGTENSDGSESFTYPAYFLFFFAAILAFIYYIYRQSLALVAEMFKFSAIGLEKNVCLIPVQGLFFLLACVAKLGIIAMGVCFICALEVTPDDDDGTHPCSANVTQQAHSFYIFFAITFGWFAFWALETRTYIVADVTAHWYWHGKEGADISRGTKHAFFAHFGSMAFAGLATWFIDELKRMTRTRPNNPIGCILVMIARCILSYIEYLFKMAVLMVAITGKSFGNSGIEVGRLFWSSFGNLYHSTGVWMFPGRILGTLNFVMSAAIGAAFGAAAYHPTLNDCEDGKIPDLTVCDANDPYANQDGDCMTCTTLATAYSWISGLCIFFIVLFLLSLFTGILLIILDTTFLCFLLDKEANVVTKPAFHAIFGDVLAHREKSMKPIPRREPPSYLRGAVPPRYSTNGAATPSPQVPAYTVAPTAQPTYPQAGQPVYATTAQPTYGAPTTAGFQPAPPVGQQMGYHQGYAVQQPPAAPVYPSAPPSGYDPVTGQPLSQQPPAVQKYDPVTGQSVYES